MSIRRADIACLLVIALAVAAYSIRLGTPPWHADTAAAQAPPTAPTRPVPLSPPAAPSYEFDESYTAFTAHRLLLGDPRIFEPAERRYHTEWPGANDLSPRSRGEWSHPPGAPLAIAAAIAAFGFSAIAARLAAVFAALITLVATAHLAGPRRAWLACLLVGFDGAFFVFARIAMPHMFLTAGLTAGAALLISATASPRPRRRWALAAAAGAALGFAVSVRWTALPVALALAAAVAVSREGRRHRMHRPLAGALATAIAVYLATYIPWFAHGHGLRDLVQLHRAMLAFHAAMPAAAAQSQPAHVWPWTLRAVTFVVDASGAPSVGGSVVPSGAPSVAPSVAPSLAPSGDQVRAVLCIGGRVLWWGLVPALLAGAWFARRGALRWLLPVAAITATWLPWALIGRFGMTYYLLPALPFTATLIAALVARLEIRLRTRGATIACAAIALALFAATYPILAAVPISRTRFADYSAVLGR